MALDIAMGLAYAQSLQVIHRDLNLGNFLISREGVVKVADFGEGKEVRDEECSNTADVGAMVFRAPENFVSSSPDIKHCDVWSFAVVLSKLLLNAATNEIEIIAEKPPLSLEERIWLYKNLSEKRQYVLDVRTKCLTWLRKGMTGLRPILESCLFVLPAYRASFLSIISQLCALGMTQEEILAERNTLVSFL